MDGSRWKALWAWIRRRKAPPGVVEAMQVFGQLVTIYFAMKR